ncbi:MAG: hypothetical protein KR126chlam4_00762 [Candidatus Anoxychlamydiales bacterium]|nr:hypothetical protein [Candidatus Anoxychlamydiales bacterium]NGX40931.1 hypothetical protein [Candidatus Anoxychlamydiales bacterium]
MKYFVFLYLLVVFEFAYPTSSFGNISKSTISEKDEDSLEMPSQNVEKMSNQDCKSSIFSIGANYSYVNIKPSSKSSFDGHLGGLHAMYEYRPMNSFYGAAAFAWRQGSANGSGGSRSFIDINVVERLGYSFTFKSNTRLLTLFSGFGFRFLGHHLNPSTLSSDAFIGSFFPPFLTDETSLRIDYHDFYIPLGFLLEYSFYSWFDLGFYGTWMPQIFSTAKIKPLGGAFWDLKETYSNFLIEVPLIFKLPKRKDFSLVLKPFFEYWQDGKSTAKTSSGIPLGLPKNTYYFVGFDLNFLYSF